MERRLSAVFAADMVGYSRLMEADEVGTLERQKVHRKEFINPTFDQFHGRIVKEMGDGLLVEFPSVVEAVQCAVTIQRAMPEREADVPEDHRITYRIGINLGDIIVEGDDIHGDGVNVAARLEQLAEPGGICISGAAYDQLRSTVEVGYESLGDVQVKNIERPIRAYRVLTEIDLVGTVIEKTEKKRRPRTAAFLGFVFVLSVAAGVWWRSWQPDFEPADLNKYALELPQQPSVAVLPFDNLTGDSEREYIADGLTENIISVLSYAPDLLVIARNSTFTFKNTPVNAQTAAEQLGVRYLVEGSVQMAGDKLRTTVQLIDAVDGMHMWSERYDRELTKDNLLQLQDEIARNVLTEVNVNVATGDRARTWDKSVRDLEEYRLLVQWRGELLEFSKAGSARLMALAHEAYERNPDGVIGNTMLGSGYIHKVLWGFSNDPTSDLRRAAEHIGKAAEIDADNPRVLVARATLAVIARKYDRALATAERALQLHPSNAHVVSEAANINLYCDQPETALALIRRAKRAEPYFAGWMLGTESFALLKLGEFEEAKAILDGILSAGELKDVRVRGWAFLGLSFIAASQGDLKEAKRWSDDGLKEYPDTRISEVRRRLSFRKDQDFMERIYENMRQLGVPE